MKEFPAFESFKTDEYDLFLPSLTFSVETIEKRLSVGGLCRDVLQIHVEEDRSIDVYVESVGLFIEIEEGWYSGSRIEVPYQLSEDGTGLRLLEGKIICTYFGGERVIPVSLEMTENHNKIPVGTDDDRNGENAPVIIRHRPVEPYLIQPMKRAFAAGETGVVRIVNNQGYPITVKVLTLDSQLTVEKSHLTVEDVAYLNVIYKRRPVLNFFRRQNESPFVESLMTVAVRHDRGEDHRRIKLVFTQLKNSIHSDIDNDRDYRRSVVMSRQSYNRFLIDGDKLALNQALKTVEKAMAYHLTDLSLRLFYILLLIEKDEKAKVKEQVDGILRYSPYFPEGEYEECLEILNALSIWFSSNAVSGDVTNWPMTELRQLFRIRVFRRKRMTYDGLERIYNQGIRSAHLLAQTAGLLSEKPFVPNYSSSFYRTVLIWSVVHGGIGKPWLERLENSSALVKYDLVDANGAMQLHAAYPKKGILKLLLQLMIKEDRVSVYGHAVSLEGLKQGIYLPELEIFYCRCVCFVRGQIWWQYVHLTSVLLRLTEEEQAYILRLYLEDPLTDKSKHTAPLRQSRHLLLSGAREKNSEDMLALAAWWTKDRMFHHDWKQIRLLLNGISLRALKLYDGALTDDLCRNGKKGIGYTWLHNKLPVDLWLEGLEDDEIRLAAHWFMTEGLTDALWDVARIFGEKGYDLEEWLHWVEAVEDVDRDRARHLLMMRYDRHKEERLVLPLIMSFRGDLKEMIDLLEHLPEHKRCPEAFVKRLLFKGLFSRQYPVEMARIYAEYHNELTGVHFHQVMMSYFVAQLLIEERYGLQCLTHVFEQEVLRKPGEAPNRLVLGLLKLYQLYGSPEPEIVVNLIKKAIKNGIILPWFKALSDTDERQLKKALFFSYHSRPDREVFLHYRAQDQEVFCTRQMKHTAMGFYTAYVLSFFDDRIEYYTTETDVMGEKHVTGSGIRNNRQVVEAVEVLNAYDVVNTIEMSRLVDDHDSVRNVVSEFVKQRYWLEQTAEQM